MNRLAHGGGHVEGEPGSYVGSLLYDVAPEHVPALVVLALIPLVAVLVHRLPAVLPPVPWLGRLRALPAERTLAVWALVASAAVHVALVPTHGLSGWSVAFAVDAGLLGWAAHRLVTGCRRAGLTAALVLAGSLLGLLAGLAARHMPDQVAMACKVVEVAGLLALGAPVAAGRARRVLATSGVAAGTALVVVGVWAVGLSAGHGDGEDGHHAGSPAVGVAMPAGDGEDPTVAQTAAAEDLYRSTVRSLARYADPAAAVAAGYAATGIRGHDFHADNPRYTKDDATLDPDRPETLVYALRDDGTPVLLGAMFQVEGLRTHGPAVGGPLTTWHAHEQVCFALLPPSLAGLTSPLGVCPAGSVTVALTNEMIHVWTVPGAPQRFGDLDEGWLKQHVLAVPAP